MPDPILIADHPALDLLNTVANVDGKPLDFWQSDEDVTQWLAQAGVTQPDEAPSYPPLALRDAARSLREVVRKLVAQRKAGEKLDLAGLNAFLARGRYEVQLVEDDAGNLHVEHRHEQATPEQLLMPLAQSAAELLATADFNLVRKCEHPECTLYFSDRTKSHRRRWCSMALCGNRHKVASFRRRQEK
jgi:predicted RNA-binding Zn ribbon-like protein